MWMKETCQNTKDYNISLIENANLKKKVEEAQTSLNMIIDLNLQVF